MKLGFMLSALALVSTMTQANAANLNTCLDKVAERCQFSDDQEGYEIENAQECKIQGDDKVAFIFTGQDGQNQTKSVLTSVNPLSCQTSRYQFASGYIVDHVSFADRIFVVLSSNRIAFIGLDNGIYELLSANKSQFQAVHGVKVDPSSKKLILLNKNGNRITDFTVDQMNKRISEKKTYSVLN